MADKPVTTPLPRPTVAIAGLLLVHVPPAGEPVSVVVVPWQVLSAPLIGAGGAFTNITTDVLQPVSGAV